MRAKLCRRKSDSEHIDKVQTLRALRVSPDEVGIGRRSLILIRQRAGDHLAVLLSHYISSPFCPGVLEPNLYNIYNHKQLLSIIIIILSLYYNVYVRRLTCNTLLDKPVFCASCLRSLASGFWLMLKYDFIVRNW